MLINMEQRPAAAACLVYPLPSITAPLELEKLFSSSQPLEVELGSGDGSFLLDYAGRHPERNFIGVERLMGRIKKLDRKGRRAGLTNLRGVRIECGYLLRYLLPAASVRVVHVYFPDPWPKRKHWGKRLVNADFPALLARCLEPRGNLLLRTDDRDYYDQMQAVLQAASSFIPMETPVEVVEIVTDFERDFLSRGVRTLRAAYRFTG